VADPQKGTVASQGKKYQRGEGAHDHLAPGDHLALGDHIYRKLGGTRSNSTNLQFFNLLRAGPKAEEQRQRERMWSNKMPKPGGVASSGLASSLPLPSERNFGAILHLAKGKSVSCLSWECSLRSRPPKGKPS
jgi:hypothetical protein